MNQVVWQQGGMVLLVCLVFVLLLALVAGMVVQSGTLQLHMAGNDQFQEDAVQTARAIAVELSQHPENFSLASAVGHVRCAPGAPDPGCDSRDLQGPGTNGADGEYSIAYSVTRREPLLWENATLRGAPSDAPGFDVGVFEIGVRVEGRGAKPGRAHVVEGVAVSAAGDSAGTLYRVYWREPGVDPL